MAFDDELIPEAPAAVTAADGDTNKLSLSPDLELKDEILADVPKYGDVMPAGTYEFRCDAFQGQQFEGEAVINITWKCATEPLTGRTVYDNVPYVTDAQIKAANEGDPAARAAVTKRLSKAKMIMEAAGWKSGSFVKFLGTNPEMKLSIEVTAKRAKNDKGEWVSTEDKKNKIAKYLPLFRSR